MPIVEKNGSVNVEYEIPKKIKEKIPDTFYYALAGELFAVHGYEASMEWVFQPWDPEKEWPPDEELDEEELKEKKEAIEEYKDSAEKFYDFDSGTYGWYAAFWMACKKLDMMWLAKYRNTLEWYDSDIFDGIIEEEMVENFVKKENEHANVYYKHIISLIDENKKAD